MAKGRKIPSSRSELYLGSYSYSQTHGTVTDVPEFGEDDVWSMVDDMVNVDESTMNTLHGAWPPRATYEGNGAVNSNRIRRYPPRDNNVGGLSLAFDDMPKTASPKIVHQFRGRDSIMMAPRGQHVAMSAPVNVPDWSKIYRVDSVESLHDFDEDVNDAEMVPPHEYLAREYARSRNSAADSVFEGVGRTLKGRDMRRVRDAVWSQTGFYG